MSFALEIRSVGVGEFAAMTLENGKTRFLDSNYPLAVKKVFEWYTQRRDYINAKGAPNRDEVFLGELEEYAQVRDFDGNWEKVCSERKSKNISTPWYQDDNKEVIWDIASEAADIAIVGISELQSIGFDFEWVAEFMSGGLDMAAFTDPWIENFRDIVIQLKDDCAQMGIDLAESILMKSAINEQHYPVAFLPWVMVSKIGSGGDFQTFARRLRHAVGDKSSSQMPDLSMSWMGESSLSRAQNSPFSSDGYAPKAFGIKDGEIWVNSDDYNNVYDGMYVVGVVESIYKLIGKGFDHDPEKANYLNYFGSAEWRETMQRVRESGVKELIVPSGSGFRYNGLNALCKLDNLKFEHMGTVEDEILFKQYLRWCEIEVRKPDIFEYQMFVAEGKIVRLGIDHDTFDSNQAHEGLVVGMDEIIVWWNDKTQQYEPIEKPVNELEAADQILKLVSGKQFFVSNATVVSHLKITKPGEGFAVQIIPMRVECGNDDEMLELATIWLDRYRKAARKEGRAKVTPGAVSLMSDFLQPYIRVRIPDQMEKMVIPFGESYKYREFIQNLVESNAEVEFLSLPEKVQNEIGISVGGFSIVGARQAFERYLLTSSWQSQASLDHSRADRIAELKKMMQIVV